MTQSVKPVIIKQSAYLRVPNDIAELIEIMGAPTGAVEVQLDEKGCALVYHSRSKGEQSRMNRKQSKHWS